MSRYLRFAAETLMMAVLGAAVGFSLAVVWYGAAQFIRMVLGS